MSGSNVPSSNFAIFFPQINDWKHMNGVEFITNNFFGPLSTKQEKLVEANNEID